MSFNPEGSRADPNTVSGEFHSRIQRDEPLQTDGHKPGILTGNDAAPEFSAQTLPPGSAPSSRTFQPNPTSDDAPPVSKYQNQNEADSGSAAAQDTLIGASSAQVHTGLGKPVGGQSSSELRHDGQAHRKNQGSGLEGRAGNVNQSDINPHDPVFADQRALNDDNAQVGRSDVSSAEERLPESAETVASERR